MDLPTTLPAVAGYVAVEDCSRIGDIIFMRRLGDKGWRPYLISDCSGHRATSDWMLRNNICVEVDYQTAKRWETVGRAVDVEVLMDYQVSREYQFE